MNKYLKKLVIASLVTICTIGATFSLTSQTGVATSTNQVTFEDGTGYYDDTINYEIGEKVVFPFIKITDYINLEM